MAMSVIVHLLGEDAFLGEVDSLPDPTHSYILLRNIRRKDGKELPYVTNGATAFLYPWSRISFVETMGDVPGTAAAAADGGGSTTVLGFFREDDKRR